jgi:hypothetical protein
MVLVIPVNHHAPVSPKGRPGAHLNRTCVLLGTPDYECPTSPYIPAYRYVHPLSFSYRKRPLLRSRMGNSRPEEQIDSPYRTQEVGGSNPPSSTRKYLLRRRFSPSAPPPLTTGPGHRSSSGRVGGERLSHLTEPDLCHLAWFRFVDPGINIAASRGSAVDNAYWSEFSPYGLGGDFPRVAPRPRSCSASIAQQRRRV